MYYFVFVAIAGLVAGTTFISSEEEGILKPVPAITTTLYHDPSPLLHIASAKEVASFFSGPCVLGYTPSPPWWIVDLGEEVKVTSITVWNKGNCCHPWLGNFTVRVGSRLSADNELYGYQICLTHTGSVENGTKLSLPCTSPVTGRYVQLTSECVDMFGMLLSCQLGVMAVSRDVPNKKMAVFIGDDVVPLGKEKLEIDCARQCLRKESCVRFYLSASQVCHLYDTGPIETPGSYSLYKIDI